MTVDVRDHHPDVRERESRRFEPDCIHPVKSGALGEKEAVVLPGELDEISSVATQLEPEPPIEVDRTPDVPDQDLDDELLRRRDQRR